MSEPLLAEVFSPSNFFELFGFKKQRPNVRIPETFVFDKNGEISLWLFNSNTAFCEMLKKTKGNATLLEMFKSIGSFDTREKATSIYVIADIVKSLPLELRESWVSFVRMDNHQHYKATLSALVKIVQERQKSITMVQSLVNVKEKTNEEFHTHCVHYHLSHGDDAPKFTHSIKAIYTGEKGKEIKKSKITVAKSHFRSSRSQGNALIPFPSPKYAPTAKMTLTESKSFALLDQETLFKRVFKSVDSALNERIEKSLKEVVNFIQASYNVKVWDIEAKFLPDVHGSTNLVGCSRLRVEFEPRRFSDFEKLRAKVQRGDGHLTTEEMNEITKNYRVLPKAQTPKTIPVMKTSGNEADYMYNKINALGQKCRGGFCDYIRFIAPSNKLKVRVGVTDILKKGITSAVNTGPEFKSKIITNSLLSKVKRNHAATKELLGFLSLFDSKEELPVLEIRKYDPVICKSLVQKIEERKPVSKLTFSDYNTLVSLCENCSMVFTIIVKEIKKYSVNESIPSHSRSILSKTSASAFNQAAVVSGRKELNSTIYTMTEEPKKKLTSFSNKVKMIVQSSRLMKGIRKPNNSHLAEASIQEESPGDKEQKKPQGNTHLRFTKETFKEENHEERMLDNSLNLSYNFFSMKDIKGAKGVGQGSNRNLHKKGNELTKDDSSRLCKPSDSKSSLDLDDFDVVGSGGGLLMSKRYNLMETFSMFNRGKPCLHSFDRKSKPVKKQTFFVHSESFSFLSNLETRKEENSGIKQRARIFKEIQSIQSSLKEPIPLIKLESTYHGNLFNHMRKTPQYAKSTPMACLSENPNYQWTRLPEIPFQSFCKEFQLGLVVPNGLEPIKQILFDQIQVLLFQKTVGVPFIVFCPNAVLQEASRNKIFPDLHLRKFRRDDDGFWSPLLVSSIEEEDLRNRETVVVCHDVFGNLFEMIHFLLFCELDEIRSKNYLLVNLPGQPFSVADKRTSLSVDVLSSIFDNLLFISVQKAQISLEFPLYFFGIGHGASVLGFFLSNVSTGDLPIKALGVFNGFVKMDHIMKKKIQDLLNKYQQLQNSDLNALYIYTEIMMNSRVSLTQREIEELMKASPINFQNRCFLLKNLVESKTFEHRLPLIDVPVLAFHTNQNSFVLDKQVSEFLAPSSARPSAKRELKRLDGTHSFFSVLDFSGE